MSTVPGSYGEFLKTACRILWHAAAHPDQVSPDAAAYWWPEILRHSQRLVTVTRPEPRAVRHPGFRELDRQIEWGFDRLDTAGWPTPPAPTGRAPRDAIGFKHVVRSIESAAEVLSIVEEKRAFPVDHLVPACRQACGVVLIAGQVVMRATAFDVSKIDTTLSAGHVVANTAPLLTGHQVLLSGLDPVTAHGTDGVVDRAVSDLHTASQRWRAAAGATLSRGASQLELVRIARVQENILGATATVGAGKKLMDTARGRPRLQDAVDAWSRTRRVWRGVGLPGGAEPGFDEAADEVERACQRVQATATRPSRQDVSVLHEQVLADNETLARGVTAALAVASIRGRLLARAETVDPQAIRAGTVAATAWVPIHDTTFPPTVRAVERYSDCLQTAMQVRAALQPAPPDPGRSAASTLAAALQALHSTQPFGAQPPEATRLHLAQPVRSVPR